MDPVEIDDRRKKKKIEGSVPLYVRINAGLVARIRELVDLDRDREDPRSKPIYQENVVEAIIRDMFEMLDKRECKVVIDNDGIRFIKKK